MKAKIFMHIQQLKMEDKKMFKNGKLLSGFQDFLPSSMLARNVVIERSSTPFLDRQSHWISLVN